MDSETPRSGAATRGFVCPPGRPALPLRVALDLGVAHVRVIADAWLAADVRRTAVAMGFASAPVASAPAQAGGLSVRLCRTDAHLPDVPPDAVLRLQAHDLARGYSTPGGTVLWTPGGRSLVAAASADVEVVAGASPAEVAWHLTVSLQLLLRPLGAYGLHAAALERGPAGVLLVGPSDVGKSTLAYALVRQGWGFVSDDSVLLHAEGRDGAVEAVAFRRRFGLDADDRFPEVAAHAVPQPAEAGKWSVDVAALYAGQARMQTAPRLLVFPEIADAAESRLGRLAPADAYGRLLAQVGTRRLDDAHTRAHHALLGRLLAQAPAVRLAAGRDVLDAPARVADLLSDALPALP